MQVSEPSEVAAATRHLSPGVGERGGPLWQFWLPAALAGSTILGTALFPADLARLTLALVLSLIAGIYVGFAIKDGRGSVLVVEAVHAAVFLGIALAGVRLSGWFLVGGYFGHGLWDFAHHAHGVQTRVPRWYIPACVVYDWLVGAFLVYAQLGISGYGWS